MVERGLGRVIMGGETVEERANPDNAESESRRLDLGTTCSGRGGRGFSRGLISGGVWKREGDDALGEKTRMIGGAAPEAGALLRTGSLRAEAYVWGVRLGRGFRARTCVKENVRNIEQRWRS